MRRVYVNEKLGERLKNKIKYTVVTEILSSNLKLCKNFSFKGIFLKKYQVAPNILPVVYVYIFVYIEQ